VMGHERRGAEREEYTSRDKHRGGGGKHACSRARDCYTETEGIEGRGPQDRKNFKKNLCMAQKKKTGMRGE